MSSSPVHNNWDYRIRMLLQLILRYNHSYRQLSCTFPSYYNLKLDHNLCGNMLSIGKLINTKIRTDIAIRSIIVTVARLTV